MQDILLVRVMVGVGVGGIRAVVTSTVVVSLYKCVRSDETSRSLFKSNLIVGTTALVLKGAARRSVGARGARVGLSLGRHVDWNVMSRYGLRGVLDQCLEVLVYFDGGCVEKIRREMKGKELG